MDHFMQQHTVVREQHCVILGDVHGDGATGSAGIVRAPTDLAAEWQGLTNDEWHRPEFAAEILVIELFPALDRPQPEWAPRFMGEPLHIQQGELGHANFTRCYLCNI